MKKASNLPLMTVVVGVDEKYQHQLATVIPNWRRHRASMFNFEIVLFYDTAMKKKPVDLRDQLGPKCRLIPWEPKGEFENQRHKMLAGHIAIPAREVSTPWWMKVDCDTYAVGGRRWLDSGWFVGEHEIVASAWGYTKPPHQMKDLDDWGDTVPELKDYPRLDLPFDERRCRHPRFCSYVMLGRTEFAKWSYRLYDGDVSPVPSQDGYHYYVIQRSGRIFKTSSMKKRGWRNRSSLPALQKQVQETL